MEELRRATYLFWSAVVGVVVCCGGTIYTAVERHRVIRAAESQAGIIPLPATPGQNGNESRSQRNPRQERPPSSGDIPLPAR